MNLKQKAFVKVDPVIVRKAQKRMKKRLLYATLATGAFTLFSNYYDTEVKLTYEPTEFNKFIIKECKELRKPFKPTWYLPTAFFQAVYGAKIDESPYVPYDREKVQMKDGGAIFLDWGPIFSTQDKEDTNILVIMHGLTGASESNYIKHAVVQARANGFRPVVFNMRGLGDTPLENYVYNNYTNSDDVKQVLSHLEGKFPKSNLFCLAISMGANMAIKYAGETGEDCKFKSIVSIANPYDLHACSIELQKLTKWVYDQQLLRKFKGYFSKHRGTFEDHPEIKFDVDEILATGSTTEFDKEFTSKLHGFNTVEDFYHAISSVYQIQNVKVPVLCINSKDDPVIDKIIVPREEIKKNKNFILAETEKGGHIDFFTHKQAKRWVYWPSFEYLLLMDDVINNRSKIKNDDDKNKSL